MRGIAELFPPPEPHWVGDGFPVRTIFFYQGLGPRIQQAVGDYRAGRMGAVRSDN